jgi:hypothetical protein
MDCRDVHERLAQHGVLLLQDPKLVSVVGTLVGKLSRSWWDHPRGEEIYRCLGTLDEDAIATKLISGKVTFVHRRLWPALYAVGGAREPWQTRGLSSAAKALLKKLPVRASGPAVRELEKRLLVRGREEHTESGRHEIVLEPWPSSRMRVESAKRQLEEAAAAIGASRKHLPWPL